MNLLLAIISWAFSAGLLGLVLRHAMRHAHPALIAVATVLLLQTGFRPLLFFADLDNPFPQSHFAPTEWEMVTNANLTILGWTLILMMSYVVNGRLAGLFTGLLPKFDTIQFSPRPAGRVLIALAPLTLAAGGTIYLMQQYGGFAQLIYASKIGKELQGLFVIQEASTLASLLAWFGVITSIRNSRFGIRRNTFELVIFLSMIVIAMGANYAWGNRYNLAILFLVFAFSWHYHVGKISVLKLILAGAAALVFLQMLKYVRAAAISDVINMTVSTESNFWLDISTSLHFVEYDAFMLAVRDAGHLFDMRAGADFVNGLLSWIPRSLLPDKQTFNIGPWFRQVYQPGIINGWPVTTIGAWYVNFGAFGIAFGAWLSGLTVRVFDEAFHDLRGNAWNSVIGFGLAFLMLEGGVNTGFPQRIVLLIVPLFGAAIYLRIRNARSELKFRARVARQAG